MTRTHASRLIRPASGPRASAGRLTRPFAEPPSASSFDLAELPGAVKTPEGHSFGATIAEPVQRRGDAIPAADTYTRPGEDEDDDFDYIIDLVEQYHGLAEDAYGAQLEKLDTLKDFVGDYKGPAEEVVAALGESIPHEEAIVQAQGFEAAKVWHDADRKAVLDAVAAGALTEDRRLVNSCQWIQGGRTALYAVTRTGDSELRALGEQVALFPSAEAGTGGHVLSDPLYYNKDNVDDNTNVVKKPTNNPGWRDKAVIAIASAAGRGQEKIWEILRHEVQHDADKHLDRDLMAGGHGADDPLFIAEKDIQRYKSEYRAYSYQNEQDPESEYMKLDNSAQTLQATAEEVAGGALADEPKDTTQYAFSERQLTIFIHVFKEYRYVRRRWEANPTLADGRSFRLAVSAYWQPDTEGMNKYNSPLVDDFLLALDAVGGKAAPTDQPILPPLDIAPVITKVFEADHESLGPLFAAITALGGPDREYIRGGAPAVTAKIHRHLDGEALAAVLAQLG